MSRRAYWLAAPLAVTLFAAPAAFAQAQTAAAAETSGRNQTIVVTARKREENLQEVPLSITAITAENLERANVTDLRDVAALTPGMTFDDIAAGLFATPTLRGLSQANVFGPRNVATFIDGVYISDNAGVDIGVLDLERVEVVKGPQSALYGRNSFSGAINYVTRRPGGAPQLTARAELGSDGKVRVEASGGFELIPDVLSVRAAAAVDQFDGTWTGAINGADFQGWDKKGGTISIAFTPTENTTIRYRGYFADDNLDPYAIGLQASNCAINAFGIPQYFCGKMPEGESIRVQRPNSPLINGTDREVQYHFLNLVQEFGDITVSVIGGQNTVDIDATNTSDRTANGIPFPLVSLTTPLFAPAVSQGTALVRTYNTTRSRTSEQSLELRVADDSGEMFRWSVGGFVYKSEGWSGNPITLDISGIPANLRPGAFAAANNAVIGGVSSAVALWGVRRADTNSNIPSAYSETEVEQNSLFAQAEFQPIEKLVLRGEVRRTEETRKTDIQYGATNGPLGGRPLTAPFGRFANTWEYTNYRVTADYSLTDSFLIYGSVATGENAGGFNTGATVATDFTFNPESNITYELGVKTSWLDDALLFNGAIFVVDWTDAQINGPPSAGSTSPVNVVRNIGAIESSGFEFDFRYALTDYVSVTGGMSINDAQWGAGSFDTNGGALIAAGANPLTTGAQGGAVLACSQIAWCRPRITTIPTANPALVQSAIRLEGLRTVRTADQTWNIAIDAEAPVFGGAWTAFGRIQYSHQGPQVFTINNLIKGGQRDIVNANIGIRNDRYTLTAYVDNALDDLSPTNALFNPVLNNFRTAFDPIYTNGRTYGVSLKVDIF
jgi:iron complex outermembrane receptor protein